MQALGVLQSAPSDEIVDRLFKSCFENRERAVSKAELDATMSVLKVSKSEALELLNGMHQLISEVLYHGLEAEEIFALLPEVVNKKLRVLIVRILSGHLQEWRNQVVGVPALFPTLQDMRLQVRLTYATDQLTVIKMPVVVMELNLRKVPSYVGESKMESVILEMDQNALDAVLEDLGRVRDQLSTILPSD